MTPEQFAEAERLFDAVIDLPAAERASYLDEHCGEASLRREVERMIQHDATLALGTVQREAVIGAEPTAGTTIGPYTILEQIGEGGFGVVYLAEQKQPVRRRVALKIIKLGMDTKQVIARFEAERQALAMMDHPNIAKVLDAGATEAGRPYFVMELVRGQSITDYCDRHKLSVEERLDLFTKTCHAVQHAHQKGIIHRDIKPSNVLVTLHDNTPVPKVIDFGIAKATSHRLTEKTLFTGHRQFVGTPEYMSPEQAEASAVDIDTRSDVYSLGVLLYELLTGTTPFDSRQLREAAYGEIQRIIREETPHKPSTRLSTIDELSSIAARRRTEPKKLGTFVRGDLDWIVMKALEKDRTRRYETASGFADDIERFIQHEPVVASPPSAAYRVRKFVRRNRSGVVAASFVAVALVLGVVGTTWGMVWALDEKRRADTEAGNAIEARNEATKRSEELEQVAHFQSEQLSSIDPSLMGFRLRDDLLAKVRLAAENAQMEPADVDARVHAVEELIAGADFTGMAVKSLEENVLDPALDAIDAQFAEQPLVQARLLQSIADTMLHLDRADSAVEPQAKALELRRRALGDDHPDTIESALGRAYVHDDLADHAVAEQYYTDVLETALRVLGADHPTTLEVTNGIGIITWIRRDYEEAEPILRDTLERRRRVLGNEHEHTLLSINNLGYLLTDTRRFDEALRLFEEATATYRRVFGIDHPRTLWSIFSLGRLHFHAGRYEHAELLYRESLAGCRRVLGDEQYTTRWVLEGLGDALRQLGRYEEGAAFYRELLNTEIRFLGEQNIRTATNHARLAKLRRDQGNFDDSAAHQRRVLEVHRSILGEDDHRTIDAMNWLGLIYRDAGDFATAEPLLRESLEHGLRVMGPEHDWVGIYHRRLARCYYEMDRFDDALVPALAELEQRRRTTPESSETANALRMCGQILVALGRLDEAEAYQRECLELRERTLDHGHWLIATARNWLGETLVAQRRFADAEPVLLTAFETMAPPPNFAFWKSNAIESLVVLYDAWHEAEPTAGHDARATHWRTRLDEVDAANDTAAPSQAKQDDAP